MTAHGDEVRRSTGAGPSFSASPALPKPHRCADSKSSYALPYPPQTARRLEDRLAGSDKDLGVRWSCSPDTTERVSTLALVKAGDRLVLELRLLERLTPST